MEDRRYQRLQRRRSLVDSRHADRLLKELIGGHIAKSTLNTPTSWNEPDMTDVRDNKAQNRFELDVEGGVAFANYRVTPSTVIITHTETPRALRGRGIASELVRGCTRTDPRRWIKGGSRLRFCRR